MSFEKHGPLTQKYITNLITSKYNYNELPKFVSPELFLETLQEYLAEGIVDDIKTGNLFSHLVNEKFYRPLGIDVQLPDKAYEWISEELSEKIPAEVVKEVKERFP